MNFASRRPKANTKTKHMYVAVLSTVALFSVGCSSSPKQTGPNAVRGNWAYTPDTVGVHPLSRFTTADQQGETAVVVHMRTASFCTETPDKDWRWIDNSNDKDFDWEITND